MTSAPQDITSAALAVLREPACKALLSREMAEAWRQGAVAPPGPRAPSGLPDRPARPARPELRAPKDMPRRRLGRSAAQRIALLHAIAHIEFNAIDLAWDIIARFTAEGLPREFYDDWVLVADEEAKHFQLLSDRLSALGAAYGDLPAHDGLWQAAFDTRLDLLARLAVVPLVLEARGLDVTPAMIARMRDFGDDETAQVLEVIYRDEIGHVAIGKRWFDRLCARRGEAPERAWLRLVGTYFRGDLKAPFNRAARAEAGFPAETYAEVAARR